MVVLGLLLLLVLYVISLLFFSSSGGGGSGGGVNPIDTSIEKSEDLSVEEKEKLKNEKMFEVATLVAKIGIWMAVWFLCLFNSTLVFVGGMHLRGLKSYRWAMAGCIAALIPVLSPFIVLGIPFGIWGIVTLKKPEVAKALVSSDN